jgi:GT2 family glycosyltransferase
MKATFCINTSRNEKDHLELLLTSLLNGVDVKLHDFLVFVDSDNQNTTDLLLANKVDFPNLTIIKNNGDPIGYAGNINYMFQKAKTDIVSYLQSDQVVCLNYDKKILSHLSDNMVLSATRVEPPLHSKSDNTVTYVQDFGIVPEKFRYEDFLRFAETHKDDKKLTNYFFAPFTLYKHLWNDIGGHDVSFIKSREDSDIALRFCLKKYNLVQCWDAMVYHFTCTSSRGIEWWKPENQAKDETRKQNDAIELKRFISKWHGFCHPTKYSDVAPLAHQYPDILKKIVVTNPPIDETKLTIL